MSDVIDRQAAIDKFEPWLKVNGYSEGELNMLKAVLYELKILPSAQSNTQEPLQHVESVGDVINRQAAIDAISGLPKWLDTTAGVCLDYADVIAVLSEHLPSAQPQRWIPCSERLPDSGEIVFVNSTPIAPYRIILATSDDVKKYADVGAIDAWMPLPEPYTERREE